MGCHQIQPQTIQITTPRSKTSDLNKVKSSGIGSKTDESGSLVVKNPYSYHPETKMPNLRLTDQEASDIANYLLLDKTYDFDQVEVPGVDEQILDEISSDCVAIGSLAQVEDMLDKMSVKEKLVFWGKSYWSLWMLLLP